jgi:amino acid adenylation domain-containing protein
MSIVEFLSHLRKLGVQLQVHEDQLRLDAPKGVLTPALKAELASRKEEILLFLKTVEADARTITSNKIPSYPRGNHIPLSFSQERLWFLDQLEPGNSAFNMPAAIRIKGKLNLDCLEQALNEILVRHEILRTNFETKDSQPVQIISPLKKLPLTIKDLSWLSSEEQSLEARKLADEEAKRPFDLRTDLLIRATLLKLNDNEHVFLLTMHHIISDGWSVSVFAREFNALYNAFLKGEPNPLHPLQIQYADFAQWQREWLQGERLASQLVYWKQQLNGQLPQLEALLDKPRPPIHTYHDGQAKIQLPSTLSHALNRLSQEENTTLFITLLAAFKVLLSRHTGIEDVIIGSPIAGRNQVEIEDLIGFFLNTLVFRTDLSGNPTFRNLIDRVKKVATDAYSHQDIPFENLLIELRPDRDLSRTPLFQVFFNMLNFENKIEQSLGLSTELLEATEISSKFDLTVYLIEKHDGIYLTAVYNSDLFTHEKIFGLISQYKFLLAQIVEDPDKKLADYSLVTLEARSILPNPVLQLDATWQGAIHSRFSKNALSFPNQVALVGQSQTWTYQELEQCTNQLAHFLRKRGLESHDLVAVYGHRSPALVWAVLGILKAGGAFLILDPAYPAKRQLNYLKTANPKGFIQLNAAGELPSEVDEWVSKSIETCRISLPKEHPSKDNELLINFPTTNPDLPISPDDTAYITFTSGSTGKPKGVVGTHRPLSHFFHWHTQTFGFHESDRFSMLSGLAHDPLLRDIFTPLWLGATLLIPDPEKMLAPGYLLSWMKDQPISVTHLTPAIEQLIIDTASDAEEVKLESLRYAFFGGETLTQQHIHALKQIAPSVACVNFYGATETPQAMAYSVIDALPNGVHIEPHRVKEIIPLGKGIDDVQILVLTNSGQLAGISEVGEIYIRTPYLSQGYLNDLSLTEQCFLKNPFTENPSDRMYKTGDWGRYLPTGEVEFLGRNDDQVKIRGLRIELGEIESALRNHPAVKQAVVIAWQTQVTDKRLVAYIVPNAVQFPNSHELKGYLQQYLPSYMIPAHFILVDAVPLTPNGKVDRRALPEPDPQAIRETVFIAPQTQLQELLAGIWADVLHLNTVGVQDNFFELGGHSLLATQIISRIRRMLHVDMPLRTLFESPTVAAMAVAIDAMQKNAGFEIPPLKPYIIEKPPRLSFSQERMWFIHQMAPESAAYNMSSSIHVSGEFDTAIVEQVFNTIIERHAILRTTFDIVEDAPVQIIAAARPITVPVIDLQSLNSVEQDTKVQELIQTNAAEPFDLVNGPLLRILIMKIGEQEHILFSSMHHIVSDQWSGGVLMREFAGIYNAFCTNTAMSLADLPVQYADYSLWQREWLKGDLLNAKFAYWKKQLAGLSVLDLNTDHPRPAVQTYNGAIEKLPLSASTIDAVRTLCRQEQLTPFMFFLGIFKILLLRYTGQQDVAVGSPIANRNWFEIEPLIGTFVNTVILRTQSMENPTFREFLSQIRDTSLDAFQHQDFPFEKLIEELQPVRDTSHSPLVQVLFNVQNAPVTLPSLYKDPVLTPLWPETRDAQFDLTLSVTTDIVPNMVLTYNTDLFKKDTIVRMLGHLETLFQDALTDPNKRILDLQMLTRAERERQLVDWNNTWLNYPQSLCVHQLVEIQAEKTPNAIAVQFNGKQVTYNQLNLSANQLAHYLRELGVTTETPVGLSMERSAEMVIGLLAILKAGGTYIPLDPLFPRDRLEYMLENSETNILLTHQQLQSKPAYQPLKKDGLKVVNIDSDYQVISQQSTENLSPNIEPHNLAYIIFTSGSTGKPKGVQIPHRAVVNFLISMKEKPGLSANDKLLSVTTLSFDIAVLEVFLPLTTGACVVVAPGEDVYDGVALMQHISRDGITVMQATPATWQMLIDAGWQGNKNLKILCGGEALSKELAKWLTQHAGSVWNMYGPTETTVWSTICEITPTTDAITIGYPIANTRIYILDKNLEPVPVGVVGELYIAGDGVSRGYLKQPELTAEKFVVEPFSNKPDAYMYKTGDQARYLGDGRIEFLGRVDFQVKVRGFRIELGEIESVLNSHPDIRQAVTIVREDTPGDKRLVAYLLPEADSKIDIGNLRLYTKAKLPDYMVPSTFMVLDEFPMTPNRKVNRKGLPAPDAGQLTTERNMVNPRTLTEAKLLSIWEELLKRHPISVKDNFFEMGGHSLLAVHMFSRIKQEFDVNLPLATLFREATIEHLAQVIQDETGPGTWTSLVEIESQGNHPPFFCVHGLTGDILWFRNLAHCLAPDYPFYGLQSRGLDGIQSPLESIEDMAAHYIEEIRLLQSSGPYYLGGASFGGTVALEMAQQLLKQGEKVSLLAIFDDSPANIRVNTGSGKLRRRLNATFRIIRNFPGWLNEFIQLGPSRMLQRVRRKLRLIQKTNKAQPDGLEQFGAGDLIDFAGELSAHRQQLITYNFQAVKKYNPKPYAGNVILFRALNRPLLNTNDPESGWQQLAPGRVKVFDINSSHEGMFKESHVEDLAQKLRSSFSETQSQQTC